jgi:mannose-6-phosphate isomerase-like protein (cupin superfamily)
VRRISSGFFLETFRIPHPHCLGLFLKRNGGAAGQPIHSIRMLNYAFGTIPVVLAVALGAATLDASAQRRGGGGTATFAVFVADSAGAAMPGVLVSVEGPAQRSARTEGGRIAFEGLPAGSYRLRFEHEGFITLEREVTARSGAPIDVKVTLKPLPAPPPPPPSVEPPKPTVDAKPAIFDVPSVFEKEVVGRAGGKTTPLACSDASTATLIQVKDPVPQHAHDDADEYLYVIGGEGSAHVAGREERLKAGVLLFVPRTVPHAFTARGRSPLVLVSTRAGDGCGAPQKP